MLELGIGIIIVISFFFAILYSTAHVNRRRNKWPY